MKAATKGRPGRPDEHVITVGIRKCRFFTLDEARAWATGAYYDALRDLYPPKNEPWFEAGMPYATACTFSDSFEHFLQRRLAVRFLSSQGWPAPGQASPQCFASIPVRVAEDSVACLFKGASESDAMRDFVASQWNDLPPSDEDETKLPQGGAES